MYQLISRLRLWQKFTLVGFIALLMAGSASLLLMQNYYQGMRTVQVELSGLKPMRDVLSLLRLMQQHRGLAAGWLAGNGQLQAERDAKQDEVGQALKQAGASVLALAQDGADVGLAELVRRIEQDWQTLASGVRSRGLSEAASFQAHTALIKQQLALASRLLDVSGLILDPEAVSFHLIASLFDQQVTVGTQKANQAGDAVHGIVDAITRVTGIMTSINRASADQTQGILQVLAVVTEMDDMTQKNAAMVEQTAATSKSLQEQADQVVQAMDRFHF